MRAVSLFSGGLDSCIAVKLMQEQNIEVVATYIDIGFAGTKENREYLEYITNQLGIELNIIDIKEQFIQDILFSPKYGYGKNFNPCIDCHANMFRVGKYQMEKLNANFMISGEVLGQRPMSQRADAMKQVKKLAQDEDNLILRPLSAKLMEETTPEKNKWVDRNKLLSISGRGRTVQLELAKKFGLENFESPAGGCLLTDRNFSNKIKEFVKFDKLDVNDSYILKYGRHLRLEDGAKLIIGRNEEDNKKLKLFKGDKYIQINLDITGPFSLINSNATNNDKILASKIILTYAKSDIDKKYNIKFNDTFMVEESPFLSKQNFSQYLINS